MGCVLSTPNVRCRSSDIPSRGALAYGSNFVGATMSARVHDRPPIVGVLAYDLSLAAGRLVVEKGAVGHGL